MIDKLQNTWNETPEYEFHMSYDVKSTPRTSVQTVEGVEYWLNKTELLLSSPSRHRFQTFAYGTTQVLYRAELYKTELDIHQIRAQQTKNAKAKARKTVQHGGQIYSWQAREKIEIKEAKVKAKIEARTARESAQAAQQLLQLARRSEIDTRKAERNRVAERRKRGLHSKVVVLKYKHQSDSESDKNGDNDDASVGSSDADDSSIAFIL